MARTARTVIRLTGNFFGIPNEIIDTHGRSLGAIGIGIYAALARYANRTTGECWPAISKLERVLGVARSTVKVYLHKFEALGLITIEKRFDEAGDPTTNLYTLLDPSPAAVGKHLAARAATDARSQEQAGTRADGGGSAGGPPSADTQPTGGSAGGPEQSSSDQMNMNKPECSRAAKDAEETPPRRHANPCLHPAVEIHRIADEITICFHCFAILETSVKSEEPCHGTVAAA
jgi:DNA-binding MarR family transcriptional regulator